MPSEKYSHKYQFLEKENWLSFDEIARIVQIFVRLGVVKVRLTGGEPLLRPQISHLVARLSTMEGIEDLALTTNGSLLSQYAFDLKKAGLKRLTVSLDSLDENISRQINGERASVKQILEGIAAAERAGFESIKVNVVVERGVNDQTVIDLVRHFKPTKHVIRFIEYMDVGTHNDWSRDKVVPTAELIALIERQFSLKKLSGNYQGEVAERFGFSDGAGEIGFISSISRPFCGDCSRARLTADGKFFTCLFAQDGFDLKSFLRNEKFLDENLLQAVSNIWLKRQDRYSELRSEVKKDNTLEKVEMFQVGG